MGLLPPPSREGIYPPLLWRPCSYRNKNSLQIENFPSYSGILTQYGSYRIINSLLIETFALDRDIASYRYKICFISQNKILFISKKTLNIAIKFALERKISLLIDKVTS